MSSLAEDYLGAGLFDRAEQLFTQLTGSPSFAEVSLEKLVYIYEEEREWQKAIDSLRKLEMLRGTKSAQVAHYYCELAEIARAKGDHALAREHLKNTVRSESGALRGALIRAALCREEGDQGQAIALYEQVIDSDRHFMTEVLPLLAECYRSTTKPQDFDAYVAHLIERDASVRRDLAYAAIIGNLNGSPALLACIERFVFDQPILASLVNAEELKSLPADRRREAIDRVAQGLRQIALSSARYRCSNCGYSTKSFIWHCPSCKQWETVRPIQNVPLDAVLS